MTPLRAFHNDPTLKSTLLAELAKHEAADALVKGQYGEWTLPTAQFKGCAIGCALHSMNQINGEYCPTPLPTGDHSRFPKELGIPIELAYHIDTVFENLPDAESQTWPRRVLEAISPGADLSGVMPALLQWTILDPTTGFIAQATPEFHAAYRRFAGLVDRDWRRPGSVTEAEWNAIDEALKDCAAWTWAGVRAWVRAPVGAWAGMRAWARARAGAHSTLSARTLTLLREAK